MGQVKPSTKGIADIVFCIDCTESMLPCIDSVKSHIGAFADSLVAESAKLQTKLVWRARVVGYRDFESDADFLHNTNDFVDSVEGVKTQLTQLSATGGGDTPESTLDAIMYATLRTKWNKGCHRVVIVFTDAPTHPTLNAKTMSDLGIKDGMELFKNRLKEHGITLFLFGQRDPVYQELATSSRATVTQFDNAQEALKTADYSKIMEKIAGVISRVVSSENVK